MENMSVMSPSVREREEGLEGAVRGKLKAGEGEGSWVVTGGTVY